MQSINLTPPPQPQARQSSTPDFNFFQVAAKHGESAVIFTADFLFSKFMMSDPKIRLPYKEDDDNNPSTADPEKEESLEDEDDKNEEQTEP